MSGLDGIWSRGDYVATTFDMATTRGIDRVFDRICIADGEIRSIGMLKTRIVGAIPIGLSNLRLLQSA